MKRTRLRSGGEEVVGERRRPWRRSVFRRDRALAEAEEKEPPDQESFRRRRHPRPH